jgi:colanic acid/amylovoran biosynthesis glycosyltransferase
MRIVIVVSTFPSVTETFISNKVKYLSQRNFHVIIFCTKKDEQLMTELFGNDNNVEAVVLTNTNLLLYCLLHPWVVMRSLIKSRDVKQRIFRKFRLYSIQKLRPDIIHFEFSGIGVSYLFEIRHLSCKKVVSCRGSAEKVKLLIHEDRKEKFRELLKEVDAIHCVSDDMRKTILPYCNNPQKIFINYPSIETGFFKRRIEKQAVHELIIISIGRFTFQKGFTTGLLAANILKQSGLSFKWLITGSGPDHEEIIFQINHLQLQDHVILTGSKPVEDVKELMENAHIYFLPSVYEGIANVALEAMSMELPVVATRSGGMEEVIEHGVNGLLANVYDHEMLATNLSHLLNDSELRNRLGKQARKTIEDRFDIRIQADKYEKIYQHLLNPTEEKAKEIVADRHEKINALSYEADPFSGKLHIGIVIPQFPSLSETFFINKVTGLCKRGHTVTVFGSTNASETSTAKLYELNKYPNLRIVTLNFSRSFLNLLKEIILHPAVFFRSIHFNLRILRKRWHRNLCLFHFNKANCHIYHFGYSGIGIYYLPLLASLKGKKIVSCRGTAENVKLVTEKDRIKKLKLLFSQVDKIHCVSGSMANTIKEYGAPSKKIFINRPAIDINFFCRNRQYESNDKIKIVSIGRLVFQKGFMVGILAIHELKRNFPHFTWAIAGDGPEMEELTSHINSLGLNQHVELLGKKDKNEIKDLYESADIYFLPSVSEGLANAVLEAMAMKLPVVSSDVGGMQEAITHNTDGILCSNYDHKDMAAHLLRLCNDFDERKRLGEEARKKVEAEFYIERYIDVFEQEYYQLLR